MASAYYHLGLLREAQGRGEDAASAFQRAIDLDTEGVLTGLIERSR
jgi:tetratricopeptide (TPR) repeat protein